MNRAVLFDLDGTLLDTLEDLAASGNAVLEKRGLPTHSSDAFKSFIGDGMRNLVRRIFPEDARPDEADLDVALAEYKDEYGRHWNVTTRPYGGVPELLDTLTAREIPIGVLSNKAHAFTVKCVETFAGSWTWAVVLGQREAVPRKPDPAGAIEAADAMEVAPGDCFFLGDSGVDMETAVNAGMIPVGALWGFREAEELQAAGARFLVRTPAEFLELLDG